MNLNLMKSIGPGLLVGCALLTTGCSSKNSVETQASDADRDSATIVEGQSPSEASKTQMLAAKDALFMKLSGRLMEAMTNQGPAAAITVCQKEAPAIAKTVSDEKGLQIGRTGVRLRNPNNVAPAWAKELVQDKIDTPTFVSLDNGHSAALLPINLKAQCLMCHGPKDEIAPVIQEQLTKLYPDDQATGFKEGELRGWFWIENPSS
ncbi:MAG: DUF3365 domain-containing protein [Rubripirellula sp.]